MTDHIVRGCKLLIGNNLVIRDGVIATIDGTPLADYLSSMKFKEGQEVNVIDHEALLHLDMLASFAGIA